MEKGFKGFQFNSKIILVDDNESFLDNLSFRLGNNYTIDTYSNPQKAIDAIISNYESNFVSTTPNFLVEIENEDDVYYSVDFPKISKLFENVSKKNTVSVVIVDYSMPLINGIEFCQKLAHLPILKIMLTGYADFRIAIDAFNKGIIDRFLVKDSDFMLEEIIKEVNVMQELFFEKLSYPLLTCISTKKETLVRSIEFSEHFERIVKETKAKEFYLLNPFGSYLLINQKGEKFYFMVLLDKHLEEFIDLAKDMNANSELINKMIARTHAPIFIDETDYKFPISDWDCLLQPIKESNSYYYCILSEEQKEAVKLSKVPAN